MTKHVPVASTAVVALLAIAGPAHAQSGAQPGTAAPATVNGQPADATGPTRAPAADSARAPGAQVAGATSDNAVQDIIVTATRRETSLEKTPIAVSAFNQAALDRQQVNNVTDLARFVPSLQFTQQGDQSAVLLTLRGIGNDTAFTEVADPEVAIYIDGVYSARAQGASVLFYDLERAEVLRGPQGTLFGRNATVGALSLVTAKPTLDKLYGNVEGVAGSYSRFGSRGAVNVPVTDNLALRFAFVTERQDGYADYQTPPNVPNINRQAFVTTGKKYYAIDQQSARVSAIWDPSSRFHWFLSFEGFRDRGSPVIALLQTPRSGTGLYSTLSDTAPDTNRYSAAVRSTMDFNVTDGLQLTYIAGYEQLGGSTQADADAGAIAPTGGLDAPTGLLYPVAGFGENRTVNSKYAFMSHELQIKSVGQRRLDYIAGIYYSHERNRIRFDVDQRDGYRDGPTRGFVGSFIQRDREIDSIAGFGQLVYHITDGLRLTGGLRYTHDYKKDVGGRNVTTFGCTPQGDCEGLFGIYPNATAEQLVTLLPGFSISNNDVKGDWGKLTYLARADADITPTTLAYASISSGFKSGNIEDGGRTAGPESITNYEIGTKSRLFDRRVTLNLAAYYSNFTGYQVNQVVNTRDANGNITASQVVTSNAKGAKAYGFEAEAVANISARDRLTFEGTVQKTRLQTLLTVDGRFDNASDPTAIRDLAGNELAHAPRFSGTVIYEHDFPIGNGGTITPRGTVHYETHSFLTYFDGDRTNRVVNGAPVYFGSAFDSQKAYSRSDFSLRYTSPGDRFLIEGFVQNIENRAIRTNAAVFGYPRYPAVFLSNLQPPRTWGVRVRAAF